MSEYSIIISVTIAHKNVFGKSKNSTLKALLDRSLKDCLYDYQFHVYEEKL